MPGVIRQGTRLYSHKMDLFCHVSKVDEFEQGFLTVKWEPPYDQEAPSERVNVSEMRFDLSEEKDPDWVEPTIAEPIEAPNPGGLTDELRVAMENDPFKPKDLLADGGYVVHDVYDSAAENDLGAALMGLLERCIAGDDAYIKANAIHVKQLMGLAMEQQAFLAQQ